MFWVYILQHEKTGKIYIGQTDDLETRIKRHNGLLKTKMRSYTNINRGDGNWNIIYKEEYNTKTRQVVLAREKYLKSHIGRDWIKKQDWFKVF